MEIKSILLNLFYVYHPQFWGQNVGKNLNSYIFELQINCSEYLFLWE